jgi:hypothetical protein
LISTLLASGWTRKLYLFSFSRQAGALLGQQDFLDDAFSVPHDAVPQLRAQALLELAQGGLADHQGRVAHHLVHIDIGRAHHFHRGQVAGGQGYSRGTCSSTNSALDWP